LLPDGVNVSSNWDITLTTNWVSVGTTTPALRYQEYTSGGVTVGDPVTFDDTLYNNSGNPVTNINMTTPVRPFQFVVNNSTAENYVFSSSTSIANGLVGLGGILKSNTGSLTLLTSNSFTGGVSINDGGSVIITNDFSLGASSGLVTLNGSTLQVNGNTTNNVRPFSVPATSSIGVATNVVARFGGAVTGAGGLTKTDNGTLLLAGTNGITGALTVSQGTLNTVGTNVLPAVVTVGNTGGVNAVLKVSGGSFQANKYVDQFTSSLVAGSVAGAAGDIVVSSGTLSVGEQFGLGAGLGGYGGLTISGGSLITGSYIVVGFNNDSAVFNLSGGTCVVTTNCMTIAAGGTGSIGVANFSAGSYISTNGTTGYSGGRGGIFVGEAGNGTLNVSGTASVIASGQVNLLLGRTGATSAGTVNLLGGTITTPLVSKGAGSGTFNFNGGTLAASASSATWLSGLNSANIYNGGATIDDGGNTITIPQPLLAPTGSGVASIPVTLGTSSGYIDSPIVTIFDNAGYGSNALATAQVNPVTGGVTNIVVTCPGRGFDPVNSSVSVSFTGGGGSPTPPTYGTILFAANGTGGLTKKGSGTTALTGVNTFGGPITVNGGTLTLNSASTYAGAVNVNAGTLAMNTATILTGNTTVSNGAAFTITQIGSATSSISNLTVGVTAGPGATLGLGLTGLNPTAPMLNCSNLTFNGTNTISVAGAVKVGVIPLVKYVFLTSPGTYTNITLPQGVGGFISNSAPNSTLYAVITSTGPGLVWTGTNTVALNLWDLGITTNWLFGSTPSSYHQPIIPGDAVTFNESGSGTVILNTNAGPSSMVISNNSKSYTFSGIGNISGPTGLLKLGTGIATLNLTNDSYTGDTIVSNGTLQAGSASAISPSANLSVGSSGTMDLAGFSNTISGLSGSGTINNSGGAAVLTMGNGNGAVTWAGTIAAGGGISIIKVGSGNSVITGTNYLASTAASQINGGTMLITNGGALHLSGGAEFWVMQNAGTASVIVDGGTLDVANNWLVVGRNAAGATGTLIVNSGLVEKAGANNIVVGSLGATGTLIVNGGQVLNSGNLWLGEGSTAVATLYLNGGLIQATQVRENNSGGLPNTPGVAYFNGGTLQATASSASFIQDITSEVMSNGLVLDDNGNTLSLVTSPLQNPGDGSNGGLIKKGSGTVYLDAGNTYTGTTLVTNGTLAGIGSINGSMVVAPLGNLGAGDEAGVGTFTIGGNLTLQGKATLRIDNTIGLSVSNDLVSVSGSITYGGILTVTNVTSDANPLVAGETFQLFSAGGSDNFTSIQGSPGPGLGYSFNPASGVLSVVAVSAPLSWLQFSSSPVILGTSMTISATNTGAGTVYLLTTTNLTVAQHLPSPNNILPNWTPIWTNVLSGSGSWTTNLLNVVHPAWNMQVFELSNTNY
jgi:autotransporter-associated beta strand protein